jgi:hypothetical protein
MAGDLVAIYPTFAERKAPFFVRLDASGNVVSKSSFSQKDFLNTLPKS